MVQALQCIEWNSRRTWSPVLSSSAPQNCNRDQSRTARSWRGPSQALEHLVGTGSGQGRWEKVSVGDSQWNKEGAKKQSKKARPLPSCHLPPSPTGVPKSQGQPVRRREPVSTLAKQGLDFFNWRTPPLRQLSFKPRTCWCCQAQLPAPPHPQPPKIQHPSSPPHPGLKPSAGPSLPQPSLKLGLRLQKH